LDEKLILHHMRTLKCSREEAIALINDDRDTDRGIAKPWDLTKEQMKIARKHANAGTRKASGNAKPRERKADLFKQAVVKVLADALASMEDVNSVSVANAERSVDFIGANGVCYTVSLTAHRAKKEG
jgi:hypothetical protein